jgi:hypothetical protein
MLDTQGYVAPLPVVYSKEVQEIIRQAQVELADERRRAAVDAMKIKLSSRPWWKNVFPFKISITRV